MLRQLLARLVVVSITVVTVVFAFNLSVAGHQEEAKQTSRPAPPGEMPPPRDSVARTVVIDRMIGRYDLKPRPAPAIPDNPPPHEGAMIGPIPHVVEPPDLVLVEVLEALPGRPISGERLVRPDGTISLGFYGDVYVKGLTIGQVKVAIIKHLRRYLNDRALGLVEPVIEEEPGEPAMEKRPFPEPPKEQLFPDAKEKEKVEVKPRSSTYRSRPNPRSVKTRSASSRGDRRSVPVRVAGFPATSQEPAVLPAPHQIKIPVSGPGRITITVEMGGQGGPSVEKADPPPPAPPDAEDEGQSLFVSPEQSANVFVDVTAYNSKYYYVLGDVQITGRINYTGNETVLDALNFAGGLLATAEPKDIQLVRPERNGKPPKVYKVDLEAIQRRGEVATNYQLFPGDRLVVGRNEVVKKTVEIDRLVSPIQSLTSIMLQEATMLRSLQFATGADRNELLKEYVDFWAKELARPGGVHFDEQTLREAFIRTMKLPPNPTSTPPTSR